MRNRSINSSRFACVLLGFLVWGSGGTIASVGPLPGTDRQLSRAVSSRLERDPQLRGHHIRVTADAGVVRLTGRVANLARRREAIRLVASQRGVIAIEQGLTIQGRSPADLTLRHRIQRQLSVHPDLLEPHLTFTLAAAKVQVTGKVRTIGRYLYLREQLEKLAGIREVDLSELRIGSRQEHRLEDEALRVAVLHLIRDPYVFPLSGRIDVETRDGIFVLTGTVPRLIDKMEALDVAALVVDHQRIRNELLIDPNFGRLQRRSGRPTHRSFR